MIKKEAFCGTLLSNDCYVRVAPHSELVVEIKSPVYLQFGKEMQAVVREQLAKMQVTSGLVFIEDKGALNYTLQARVETAVNRSRG